MTRIDYFGDIRLVILSRNIRWMTRAYDIEGTFPKPSNGIVFLKFPQRCTSGEHAQNTLIRV